MQTAISRILTRLMADAGISQAELSRATKVGQSTISRILKPCGPKGIKEPTDKQVRPIAEYFGITSDQLRGHAPLPPNLDQGVVPASGGSNVEGGPIRIKTGLVPVVGKAKLGVDGFFEEMGYPPGGGDGYLKIFSDDPDAYALRVVGNSMEPRIRSGEFVMIEPSHSYIAGDEVLVKTDDGQSMIKVFMYRRDGEVRLLSVNDAHPPLTLPETSITKIHPVGAIVKASRLVEL